MTDNNGFGKERMEVEILRAMNRPQNDTVGTVTVYVAGENVPDQEWAREAVRPGMALRTVQRPDSSRYDRTLVEFWAQGVDALVAEMGRWMDARVAQGNASPLTISAYLSDWRNHLNWLAERGTSPLYASLDELIAYRTHLIEECAVTTVGRKLAGVRRAYGIAHKRGFLMTNLFETCAEELKPPKDKTEAFERIKFFSDDAIKGLLRLPDVTQPKGTRDKAMLVMMYAHGMRVSEVAGLELASLDPTMGDAGALDLLGKGRKHRKVYLTLKTREVLENWLAVRNLMHLGDTTAVFVEMQNNAHLDRPLGRMTTRGIRSMVDSYLERLGEKKGGKSCHALRHTYATRSLDQGASLLAISVSMGHSSVTTTQVYAKLKDAMTANPAKYLDDIL